MRQREAAISRADVRGLTANVSKLGGYALGLLDLFDLGIDRDAFRRHLKGTRERLAKLVPQGTAGPVTLRPKSYSNRALLEATNLAWDYPQDLRFAAGTCMLSQKYQRWMSQTNLQRALMAKVLYECQWGLLDDVIDNGAYGYLDAKNLYHLVLSSMTDPALDLNAFRKRLMAALQRDQLELYDAVVTFTQHFNRLFHASPHGTDLFVEMERLDERLALGQALTVFQKEPHLDVGQIARISRNFSSPRGSVPWYERLASYISGGARFNLIDAAFLKRKLRASKLQAILDGWYFFDIALIFLNNVASIHQDLGDGVLNLALISMREKECLSLGSVRGYRPELSSGDYEGHLRRLAATASRGLETLSRDFPDPDQYYPFVTLMMPVVMLADWIGKNDEMIHRYVEALAPSLRRAAEKSGSGDGKARTRAVDRPLVAPREA